MRGRPTAARRASAALFLFTLLAWASPSYALDTVTISTFQGSFVALPLYVAKAYKLYEKHGLDAEFIYGTGIQPTNILVGGKPFLDLVIEETHSCYRGDRSRRHPWGYGCGECPACRLRAEGFARFVADRGG